MINFIFIKMHIFCVKPLYARVWQHLPTSHDEQKKDVKKNPVAAMKNINPPKRAHAKKKPGGKCLGKFGK